MLGQHRLDQREKLRPIFIQFGLSYTLRTEVTLIMLFTIRDSIVVVKILLPFLCPVAKYTPHADITPLSTARCMYLLPAALVQKRESLPHIHT